MLLRPKIRLGKNAGIPRATYLGRLSSASGLTTYNLGNISVPANGILVALVGSRAASARTISSVSLGGAAATVVGSTTNLDVAGIAYVEVSAGNNNVTVVFSGAMNRCGVDLFLITGYKSATPTSTSATSSSSTSTTYTLTLNYNKNSVGVYTRYHNGISATWSGATEDADAELDTGAIMSTGHIYKYVEESGYVETITSAGTSAGGTAGAGGSWE